MATEYHRRPTAESALLHDWSALLDRTRGGGHRPPSRAYGEDLLRRWSEPHRRYHTVAHLEAVLHEVDALAGYAEDPDTVRLAAWFHDAVHRPEHSENEAASARLAVRALGEAGVPRHRAEDVARLVLLTTTHAPEDDDRDGEVLCDADLAVLAGMPQEYAAYAAAVREEYSFLPDAEFRAGRAAVLRELLELPALFRTPPARQRYAERARLNLTTELELLSV
jgi:predicted metal-dependent HD superfamily phosphohydrolase